MPRIFEAIHDSLTRFDAEVCFAAKKKGVWHKYSAKQYREIARNVSYGLIASGLQKGDKIASLTNNRPEWNFLDLGMQQLGILHVPIYPTISEQELVYILNDCQAKFVFVANPFLWEKTRKLLPMTPHVLKVFSFDLVDGVSNFSEIIDLGKQNPQPEKLKEISDSISADDVYTVLYTSGTTGDPKGVMLTHTSHMAIIKPSKQRIHFNSSFTALSYLPISHIFERTMTYLYQIHGMPVYYAETLTNIMENFREVKPHVVATVPLLLERIYDGTLAKERELTGKKRKIFRWALNLTSRFDHGRRDPWYSFQLALADILVYKKIREVLGGRLERLICGGAALKKEMFQFYWASGIPIYQVYGLTETSGLVAMDTFGGKIKLNKCGTPLDHLDVKIAEDGEILVQGISIMKGYYNNPELTSREIDPDGWFHTGDLGLVDQEGYLQVYGRKKEYFKTASGRYVNPQEIENILADAPFISRIVVFGANQISLSALVVPDFDYLAGWCSRNNLNFTGRSEMLNDDRINRLYRDLFDQYNATHWKEGETIRSFKLLACDWSIETGEITPSLKLKRNYILQKYQTEIESLLLVSE